jgi:heptaprenyl diphosphate synthase
VVPVALRGFSQRVVDRLGKLAGGLTEPLGSPVRALAERPGKCLRSTLLGACARFGSADEERLVRLGALVELLHMASLLHDDVIDRAAVRRGAPAAHTVVGDELALLSGLACFALAGTEAADLGDGVDRVVSQTVAGLAYGEMLDVERAFDTALALPDYLELVERKTGDLFRLTCLLGAADAGVGREEAGAMARFGTSFGVAFQILDDCLDLAPDRLDKPTGTDHLLGLFGAPTLCALGRDTSGELAALLLSTSLDVGDLPAVRALVVARGGLVAAEGLARQWYERAMSSLDDLPTGDAREVLAGTADLVWRTRT